MYLARIRSVEMPRKNILTHEATEPMQKIPAVPRTNNLYWTGSEFTISTACPIIQGNDKLVAEFMANAEKASDNCPISGRPNCTSLLKVLDILVLEFLLISVGIISAVV